MRDPAPGDEPSPVPPPARSSIHGLVHGRVQGVGFRFFVVRAARRLDLTGSVRNLPDGGVEVLAQGPEEALRRLVDALHHGPMFSQVERVDVKWGVPFPPEADFTIGC